MIVGNVLGNALTHGDGTVRVELDGPRLVLSNRSAQLAHEPPAEGFGFGLQIAGELCTRFGWRLNSHRHQDWFVVQIEFQPTPESSRP